MPVEELNRFLPDHPSFFLIHKIENMPGLGDDEKLAVFPRLPQRLGKPLHSLERGRRRNWRSRPWTRRKIEKILGELFSSQRFGVLATQGEGNPYGNLVAIAATEDLTRILFATMRSTRKFNNIAANGQVAMVLDNRSNRASDFRKAVAVTATGFAAEVPSSERGLLLKIYLTKHPSLKELVTAPTCALMRIGVERYYVAYRFQNVMEWDVRS